MEKPLLPEAANAYRGQQGEAYLTQRQGAVNDHVQGLRASLFRDLGSDQRVILDFGCGTGATLRQLDAVRRIGIEIGDAACVMARAAGIEVHNSLGELDSGSVDVAISFHAIEHVDNPLSILRELGRVVKPGGYLRLIVPGENPLDPRQRAWFPNNDKHLYTWTPLLFGNLAEAAGLEDIKTSIAPMPTGSRLVHLLRPISPLSRWAHRRVATRQNSFNVILNARVQDNR
jgi:SAM-dependent methyltransferase